MAIKYEYSPSSNIVHVCPHGEHSLKDVLNLFKDLINDVEIKHSFINVVDLENVERFLFDSREGEHIAQKSNGLKAKKKIRATVFIGKRDLAFGIARMMQIFHEINDPTYDVYVARSREEANGIIKGIAR